MTRAGSRKLRLEPFQEQAHLFGHEQEGGNYSEIFDSIAPISERYHRNDVRIHMHARGGLEDFCALFEAQPDRPTPDELTQAAQDVGNYLHR